MTCALVRIMGIAITLKKGNPGADYFLTFMSVRMWRLCVYLQDPSLSVTVLCFEKYSPQPDDPQHQLATSMIY